MTMTWSQIDTELNRRKQNSVPLTNEMKIVNSLQEISVILFAINTSLEELGRNVYLVAEQVASK
jgi:hypothetical protein